MAFRKVLALALLCSAASAAPQTLIHGGQIVRAFPQAATISHAPLVRTAATHVTHASSPVVQQVRTIASPLVHTVARPAPVVHEIAPATTVVRTAPAVTHVAHEAVEHEVEVVNAHPQYNFGYSVSDAASGDFKDRQEARDGDQVTGSYTVADPDGRIRHVEYTADAVNGFQARVTYDGQENAPVAIPFNAPATTSAVVATEPAVIAERANAVHTVAATPAVRAVHAVAAAPAVRAVHTAAVPATVRAIHSPAPLAAVNAVHTSHAAVAPATTVVRSSGLPFAGLRTFAAAPAGATFINNGAFGVRALPVGAQFVHV